MAIIPWPDCLFITSVEWTPPDPSTQVNESEFTGWASTTILPVSGKWMAKITFDGVVDEDSSLAFQAFRTALKGQANSFRLPATMRPQFTADPGIKVNGSGQTGYQLNVRNGNPGAIIKAGHKLTLADQMVMNMTTVAIGADGTASLTISNPLRRSPSDGNDIEAMNPYAMVVLADTTGGWTAAYPETYDFATMSVKERFL